MSISLRSGFYALLEKGSGMVFGFGSLFFLLRILSKEEMGAWVLFLTVISFVEVARIGLLQNALVRFLSTSEEQERPQIATASFVLNMALTLFSALFLLILGEPLAGVWEIPVLPLLFFLYLPGLFLLIPLYHVNFIQQFHRDFRGIFLSNFIRKGIFFAFVCWLFFSGAQPELPRLVLVQVVGIIVGAIAGIIMARPYLSFSRKLDRAWVKKLFHFGKFVFGTNINAMLYKSVDKIMLGSMVSRSAVALYEPALRIASLAEVPSFSIAAVVFPDSAKQAAEQGPGAVRDLYERSVGLILALVMPFALVGLLFPRFCVGLLGGEAYLEAAPLLQLTMVYTLFIPFAVQFGTALDAIGRPRLNFLMTILGNGINVICNYLFIRAFGLIGAPLGTLTTYLISFVIYQTVLFRILGVRFYQPFRYIAYFYTLWWKKIRR